MIIVVVTPFVVTAVLGLYFVGKGGLLVKRTGKLMGYAYVLVGAGFVTVAAQSWITIMVADITGTFASR